ncbi:Outer membrane receptor proteins, mostly Fe transport [Algoriphagus locisalis]|uniref:Outer membrane receptor proteins, mostly Fe transport n=1 Tax=Algoriphagus locisalis TaxID=305507 RepID=A0A1I6Y2C3_9BACT|nr:TonB-dependent receptor [Algoriphagus locisalis]SFT44586.1 Outer membrane receptor proteins, mostly Fe transport [Algoriphagus locisalis]
MKPTGKRSKFILLSFFVLLLTTARAQENGFFSAEVLDVTNTSPLPGASVYWENDISSGVVSDIDGVFRIKIKSLPARLVVSFIGYETSIRVIAEKDLGKTQRFFLKPEDMSLDEIIIQERRPDEQVRNMETGKATIPIATIKNIPALFGEVDLLRSLQLLPGVQTAGEGTTGLFVRGGSADQNLVQLDGAPIYNPSHFFGFFSVFNPDALDQVELYKGNMPASFGGRLSALIDVTLREGNTEQIHGEGGIGSISSRLTLDGPLFSDKSTFVISGRRTYADLFLKLSNDEDLRNNKLNFHDLSGKLTFLLSDKDKLTISSYQGSDFLGLDDQFGLGWTNWISSAQWSRNSSEKLFFDLQGYHSRYNYRVEFDDPSSGFEWRNKLSETGMKVQWTLLNSYKVQSYWGFQSQLYHFAPIELNPAPESNIQPIVTNPKNGFLNSAFAGITYEITPKLSTEAGLRWGFFNQIGKGVDYIYEGNEVSPDSPVVDTLSYKTLENMKFYQGLEPRIAFRYLINDELSVKAAYNRNFQYVQIASNSSAGLPIDRWILAGTYVPPIRSDQVSLGLFKNFDENRWEFSVEGYYKDLRNVIDLRNGAQVLFTDNVETELLTGNGWSYGAEFLLRKNIGKTTGWLAYTYSRAWRKIDGISLDQAYNPRFDRPHDITLVLNHEFSPAWSAGLTFIYTTGQAVSFPIGVYDLDNQSVPLYSDFRNEDRFPDYHRMDASVTWKNADKGRKWKGSWNFSIYNLYGRKNPFAYEFREIYNDDFRYDGDEDGPKVSTRQGIVMTYLFTFLPSITYNFQF